jgi:hypothetical protein
MKRVDYKINKNGNYLLLMEPKINFKILDKTLRILWLSKYFNFKLKIDDAN